MATKKTMTLNLTDAEMAALEALSVEKDVSKTAILRQALRREVAQERVVPGQIHRRFEVHLRLPLGRLRSRFSRFGRRF